MGKWWGNLYFVKHNADSGNKRKKIIDTGDIVAGEGLKKACLEDYRCLHGWKQSKYMMQMSIEFALVCSFVGRGIVVCVGFYYFVCFLSVFIFIHFFPVRFVLVCN